MTLRQGLVGHWTMDDRDTQGGIIRDRSGYGHHATLYGGVTTSTTSPVGQSHTFDGTDDYSGASHTSKLNVTFPITIAGWINTDDTSKKHQHLLGKRTSSSATPYAFRVTNSAFHYYFADGSFHVTKLAWNWSANTWYHIAVTVDTSGNITFYVDGSVHNTATTSYTPNTSSAPVGIGSYSGSGVNEVVDGSLSDVRLYNRVLSDAEVNELSQIRDPRHLQG